MTPLKSEDDQLSRIGVTGHMNLAAPTVSLVDAAIRQELLLYGGEELIGVSCIAAGSDSIFANIILDLGGTLEVILPATDYRDEKVDPENLPQFDWLMRQADAVRFMPYAKSNRDAYAAANAALISSVDRLFAVWDGGPSGSRGGTADVVQHAKSAGTPVVVIWPQGAMRDTSG